MPVFPFFSSSSFARESLSLDADEREQMVDFLQRLVRTPSPSTQESAVAQLIEQELRRIGMEDVRIDRAGNVIARIGDPTGPTLLYDAHMDTVEPASGPWPHPPYEAVIEDGVLYGLGAADAKGSIAAMVYAAKRLVESRIDLDGSLLLAFVVQQEPCEGCALKVLVEEEGIKPDWVVLGDPSDLQIMRGQRGRVLFKVTVHGKSAHASNPALGRNAITAAARLIFGIDLLAADLPGDPFLGPGDIAVTGIESDSPGLNAIPDRCIFYVDRRLTLGETAIRAQTQIEAIIEREGIKADVEIVNYTVPSYTGYPFDAREAFHAWALDEEHELLRALVAAMRHVGERTPTVGHWTFSTDGVYSMGEMNIPTVGFGPGEPRYVHTVDEQVRLDDVARAAQVYALLAAQMLSRKG
ncbi:MAG: YgeY family selenium metabolism-linked hydrolase [Chloroflexi bacterium]|nr:YgeY family selenium metabolism-linked hydrolase [Chloroflexota bacterium]